MQAVARHLHVRAETLLRERMTICEHLGRGSVIVKLLHPTLAATINVGSETRCSRCGLRGHDVPTCDLRPIEWYAERRSGD